MMQQPSLPADWTYSTYCKRYLDDKLYIPTEYRDEGYKTFGAQDYDKGLLNYPNCKGLKGKEFQHSYRETEIYNRTKEREFELITPHDLHATFKDILYHQYETSFSNYTYRNFLPDSRGSSLLRDFEKGVPRNCKILPISSQYCICQFKKVIVVNSTLEEQLGNFVMDRITEILKTNNVTEQCEPEVLKKVKALLSYDMPHDQLGVSAIYDITFETSPSGAVFQILIRSANGSLELAGSSFTRLNEYGSHGACMSKDTLKPLCYCKKKIIHSK
uniref:Vitellogenin domain-containing protein n=1 Tax=Heterorhabditis bacteriophora TaxID=37862 RepID=A0A1I7XFE1_HETBA